MVGRILAVIRELRPKPLMQRRDQPLIVGRIGQLRAILQRRVCDADIGRARL